MLVLVVPGTCLYLSAHSILIYVGYVGVYGICGMLVCVMYWCVWYISVWCIGVSVYQCTVYGALVWYIGVYAYLYLYMVYRCICIMGDWLLLYVVVYVYGCV